MGKKSKSWKLREQTLEYLARWRQDEPEDFWDWVYHHPWAVVDFTENKPSTK